MGAWGSGYLFVRTPRQRNCVGEVTSAAQGAKPRQMLGGFGDDPRTMRARPGLDSMTVKGGAAAVWLQAVKVALLP